MKPFGQLLDTIAMADNVVQIKAECEYCDNKATFTKLKENTSNSNSVSILIGGDETYVSVCRQHYTTF
jgi:thymidine kinase